MEGLGESRWVEAHGLRLHYVDYGGSGQPVLLLHGLQDCARLWDFFAPTLADAYHVISLDHRGHGDSPWAPTYSLDDYVEEVRGVIQGLALRDVILMGHSAGSKNAWVTIARYPSLASRLVITDMDPDGHNPGSVEMITRYKSESDEYATLDDAVERLRTRQPKSSEEVLRHNAEALTKPLPNGGRVWKRDRRVVTEYDRPDAWAYLPRVTVPTLIVRGAISTLLTSPVARRMNDAIPDCRLVEIPGGHHWAHLEFPHQYARIVREFLGK